MSTLEPWLTHYPKGVDFNRSFTPRPVFDLITDAARDFPARPCTSFLGKTMTYAEMAGHVRHAAKGLQTLGVGKGTRVGLFLPNCPTFIVGYYAVLMAGGTVVNFNPLYSLDELEHQVRDSGTELMVTLNLRALFGKVETLMQRGVLKRAVVASFPALLPTVKATLFKLAKGKELANIAASPVSSQVIGQAQLMVNDGKPVPVTIDPMNDLAVLQYTGGTTGVPKGAMLTHANVSINVQQVRDWAGLLTPGHEKVMAILPFFHVFGMTVVMNFGVQQAAELILMPRFEITEAMRLIASSKPTCLPGVPTLFNAILNHRLAKTTNMRSLKFCFSGGAALPLEVKRDFEALTGAKLIEGYGLSETSPVLSGNPMDGPVKEGSIGLPFPGTIISIRSLDDPAKEMPLGEDGEICVAGPQVMPGYWRQPEETAAVFTGKFFRTGDIGHMDSEGFTFIVDRLKDMINTSGFKVYPRRIEEVLYEHEAVEEVIVLGMPDKYRGEAPRAYVKLREGKAATPQALMEFIRPKLSRHELPDAIELRASLPKTAIGKLSKKDLKAEVMAALKAG